MLAVEPICRCCFAFGVSLALIASTAVTAHAQRQANSSRTASRFTADPGSSYLQGTGRDALRGGAAMRRDDTPQVGPSGEAGEVRGSFDPQGFVGRDAEEVRENFDRMSRGQQRGMMFDMMLENLNEMRRSRQRWQEQQYEAPPVRIRLRPVFVVVPRQPEIVESTVQTTLEQALTSEIAAPIVTVRGNQATLEGAAGSQRARQVAERMALLQPGVSRVENRIEVRTAE